MDLIRAARRGDLKEVKLIIEKGRNVNYIENLYRWTPLLWAIEQDRIDICRVLLDHGADVNQRAIDGLTPLLFAVSGSRIDIIKLLLIRGANVNHENKFGFTVADYAYHTDDHNDYLYIMKILRWRGAKISYYTNIDRLLLIICSRVIPRDLLREIHTKWIS
jgi:ankyrin repeat protein